MNHLFKENMVFEISYGISDEMVHLLFVMECWHGRFNEVSHNLVSISEFRHITNRVSTEMRRQSRK